MRLAILTVIFTLFGVAEAGARAADVDFSAGENPWVRSDLTREDLLPALEMSADYLVRNQQADGQFIYNKDVLGRCCTGKPDRYSLIRHLGAVYALLRAYQILPSADYIKAAKLGLDFANGFVAPYGVHKSVVRGFGNALSLGENGFMLIDAVLYDHIVGRAEHLALAKDLEAFLTESLVYDGPLATKEKWAESQAVIGIVHYHKYVERDPAALGTATRWLEAMAAHDQASHWSIQAIDWVRTVDPTFAKRLGVYAVDAAKKLAEPVVTASRGAKSRLIGSRKKKLLSCNATARNEGLLAAYAAARAVGRLDDARYLWARVREHLAFALQFQFGLPGNLYVNDADLTRTARLFNLQGGLANDPRTGTIRIDYVAHHIRALVTYLQTPGVPTAAGLRMDELESYAGIEPGLPEIR